MFASVDDVAQRLGRDLSDAEKGMAIFGIEAAEAVIAEAVERDDAWAEHLDPVPRILKLLAVELACRGMANPNGLSSLQEQLGSHQYTESFRRAAEGAGFLLTDQERGLARRAVLGELPTSLRTPAVRHHCFGS